MVCTVLTLLTKLVMNGRLIRVMAEGGSIGKEEIVLLIPVP